MTLSSQQLTDSVTLFRMPDGEQVSVQTLKELLPDKATTLFFAQLFKFGYHDLQSLVTVVWGQSVFDILHEGGHSTSLQEYIQYTVPDQVSAGVVYTSKVMAPSERDFLAEAYRLAVVDIAQSIKEVGAKLTGVIGSLQGKKGSMVFQHMRKMNAQRPGILGTYGATITHAGHQPNLVILDVSGSMTEPTVRAILDETVGLAWESDSALAIVSNTTTFWEPGEYSVQAVLEAAEFSGTQYATHKPLFEGRNWGVVVTIADYDSSWFSAEEIKKCDGHIGTVLDLSLVNRPTYLAECVGQLADEVRPLLIGHSRYGY